MGRPFWKFKFFSKNVWRSLSQKKKKINIYNRGSTIPKKFNSKIIILHQGKFFKRMKILKYFKGLKFGEFGFTKRPFYFPQINKKKK